MRGYSFPTILGRALRGHRGWPPAWRSSEPGKAYDVVVVGAGGHGLATAYYLAKNHGITNVAVLEKGWLGGGNTGRNTQVTRSNYFWPQSAAFFERSLKLYENLSRELNFNVMLSQRGILTLAHSHHEMEALRRWANAIRINGIDSEVMTPAEIGRLVPLINLDARFPVHGGFIQRRGGISRHDAVAWGLCSRGKRPGGDHRSAVRGYRFRHRQRPGQGGVHHPGTHCGGQGQPLCGGPHGRAGGQGGFSAYRSPAWRCRRWSASRSSRAWIPSSSHR